MINRMIFKLKLRLKEICKIVADFRCFDLSDGSPKNELSCKLAKKIQVEKERSGAGRTRLNSSVAIEES